MSRDLRPAAYTGRLPIDLSANLFDLSVDRSLRIRKAFYFQATNRSNASDLSLSKLFNPSRDKPPEKSRPEVAPCMPAFNFKYSAPSIIYTEKYYLDYTENKAHSLGVRKTIRVLSGKLSKPA